MKELVIIDAVDAAGNRIREDNPVVCTDCVALPLKYGLFGSLGGKDLQELARINIIDSADDDAECEHCGWSKPFTPITDSYDLVRDRLHSLKDVQSAAKELVDLNSKEKQTLVDIKGQCAGLEYALGILQDMSIRSEKITVAKVWKELDKS